MRALSLFVTTLILAAASAAQPLDELDKLDEQDEESAHELGARAFAAATEWPLDRDRVIEARVLAERALGLDPLDAMAGLGASAAILADGFRGGDPFAPEGYEANAVARAREQAVRALARDPGLPELQAQMGLISLLSGEDARAERSLAAARELAPRGFHGLLYSAALALARGDQAEARQWMASAKEIAESGAQQSRLHDLRINLARLNGNEEIEESLYLAYLAGAPEDASSRVRYAEYLTRVGRYRDAVSQYEEVLATDASPSARRGLEKARLRERIVERVRHRSPAGSQASPNASRSRD